MSRFACSDIHGCSKTFKRALNLVNFTKDDTLYIIGDFRDRGPDSKGVFDLIFDLIGKGYNIVSLKGNHEEMLLNAYYKKPTTRSSYDYFRSSDLDLWLHNGGNDTLLSFNVSDISLIPEKYISFIENLKSIHIEEDFVFVHGGLNFLKEDPLIESSEDYMLWSRNMIANSSKIGDRKVISGHTPRTKDQILKSLKTDNWLIDRGCVFNGSDYGHLAILNLDTKYINFVKNIDIIEKDF